MNGEKQISSEEQNIAKLSTTTTALHASRSRAPHRRHGLARQASRSKHRPYSRDKNGAARIATSLLGRRAVRGSQRPLATPSELLRVNPRTHGSRQIRRTIRLLMRSALIGSPTAPWLSLPSLTVSLCAFRHGLHRRRRLRLL